MTPPDPAFRRLGDRRLYGSSVFEVVDAALEAPDGRRFNRDVVRHPGAVAVVAVEDGEVVLVRQYRPAVDRELLEIPAGRCDVEGEPPEGTARRELVEEAGLRCDSLESLGACYNSPGFCDEITRFFLASGLHAVPTQPDGVEEEWMTVEMTGLGDVGPMIESGEICDAKTVAGLLLAMQRMGL